MNIFIIHLFTSGKTAMADIDTEKRELILEAAMKLFFHYGFKKTAMADIAREAGLAVGTLYNFFDTKEDIVVQCAEQCKCGFLDMMREVAAGRLRPDSKLREMMLKRNLGYHDQFKDTPHA
ncbi:MAG: helix-turn-helix domain-containing protein, partial [Thermodesulfobacteriota bacterium]